MYKNRPTGGEGGKYALTNYALAVAVYIHAHMSVAVYIHAHMSVYVYKRTKFRVLQMDAPRTSCIYLDIGVPQTAHIYMYVGVKNCGSQMVAPRTNWSFC